MKPIIPSIPTSPPPRRPLDPFRRAVLRGLAILLPPLLTIVIFLWVGSTVTVHLLEPLENSARWVLVEGLADIPTLTGPDVPQNTGAIVAVDGKEYQRVADGHFVPRRVYEYVEGAVGKNPMPSTAKGLYTWYVDHKWLPRRYVVPLFLCIFLLVLYLLGKFLAAGVGRFFWNQMERIIHRVPLVRNVYSSIKQVTDFLFTEPEIQYTRVVAIEYPRKGIWTLGFVTGEAMPDLRDAFDEPMVSAFVPHSPMPFTGFAVTVKKSETFDLSITVDQALQFVVSCGVVIPPPPPVDGALGGKTYASGQQSLALSSMGDDD